MRRRAEVLRRQRGEDERLQSSQLAQLRSSASALNDSLSIARGSLDALNLRAPVTGQLTAFSIQIGQSLQRGERLGQIDSAGRNKLRAQVDLALDLDRPVVIHCREALGDLLAVLESLPRRPPGVFHCFSGTEEDARRALELGFHVSFTGNVTYPKAQALRDAAVRVPPDRILAETDSPYLAPQPLRGQRNEPRHVIHTLGTLAAARGEDPDELERRIDENATAAFGLQAA